MRTADYRGGARWEPAPRDLTRTAVLIGLVLTLVVVLVVALSALFGPRRQAVSAASASPVVAAGHREETEGRVRIPGALDVGDDGVLVGGDGPAIGTEPAPHVLPACTRQVSDATLFRTAAAEAGTDDVICILAGTLQVRRGVPTALAFARAQLGKQYVWGGNGAKDGGFDCSGLTTAAFAEAGIHLPRTAQTQYNAGPRLSRGQQLQAGDLVFFGGGPRSITHVGMAVSSTQMINAPQSGEVIKFAPIHRRDFIGATRPARSAEDHTNSP